MDNLLLTITVIATEVVLCASNLQEQSPGKGFEPGYHIIGGITVRNRTKYPFFVQVLVYKRSNKYSRCGGTILSKDTVLTAAHCLFDQNARTWIPAESIKLRSGDFTRYQYDEKSSEEHGVHEYLHLNKYGKEVNGRLSVANGYDVVLLKLETPIGFDLYRAPLEPCDGKVGDNNEFDQQIRAIGLGYVDSKTMKQPDMLMQVNLTEISDDECRSVYSSYSPPVGSQICHNSENTDSCYGDSGGPVFLVDPETDLATCVYGVVSYGVSGVECGDPDLPTVAARVSYYMGMFDGSSSPDDYASDISVLVVHVENVASKTSRCLISIVLSQLLYLLITAY